MFFGKCVLKIYSKITGEHQCRSVISIKLRSSNIEITLRQGYSLVNLLHTSRTPFPKNTHEGLLLCYKSKGCSPVSFLHIFRTPFHKNTYEGLLLLTVPKSTLIISSLFGNIHEKFAGPF